MRFDMCLKTRNGVFVRNGVQSDLQDSFGSKSCRGMKNTFAWKFAVIEPLQPSLYRNGSVSMCFEKRRGFNRGWNVPTRSVSSSCKLMKLISCERQALAKNWDWEASNTRWTCHDLFPQCTLKSANSGLLIWLYLDQQYDSIHSKGTDLPSLLENTIALPAMLLSLGVGVVVGKHLWCWSECEVERNESRRKRKLEVIKFFFFPEQLRTSW